LSREIAARLDEKRPEIPTVSGTLETTKSRALASNQLGVVVVQPSVAWAIATLFFAVR